MIFFLLLNALPLIAMNNQRDEIQWMNPISMNNSTVIHSSNQSIYVVILIQVFGYMIRHFFDREAHQTSAMP